MNQSHDLFKLCASKDVEGWTDKVNTIINRFRVFSARARSDGSMNFKYSMTIDGVVIHVDEEKLSINLHDSCVFAIHQKMGSGWGCNNMNSKAFFWVGHYNTVLDPSIKSNLLVNNIVYDLSYPEESHFQLSTLHNLVKYEDCVKALELCHSIDLKDKLIQIYPLFFHEEVQCTLEHILYGYDK
ncbi:hypothetical protein ACMG5I_02700 [Escherichia coli]|uniref:hypothetical protein n=1 Tax=Escherichia coli TaxID=562 RepID=UPI002376EAE5|nr:hypothetical protein vBEcoMphAPEC6_00695 [Escherichia phage ph0011]